MTNKRPMARVFPIKIPVNNLQHRANGFLSRIPIIRDWLNFASQRKQISSVVLSLRAQLDARCSFDVDNTWIEDNQLRGAAKVLLDSLARRLGWQAQKIAATDPMSLLLLNEDDFLSIEVQMDLEHWLGKSIDPRLFNDQVAKATVEEAAAWLAKTKATGP